PLPARRRGLAFGMPMQRPPNVYDIRRPPPEKHRTWTRSALILVRAHWYRYLAGTIAVVRHGAIGGAWAVLAVGVLAAAVPIAQPSWAQIAPLAQAAAP